MSIANKKIMVPTETMILNERLLFCVSTIFLVKIIISTPSNTIYFDTMGLKFPN